MSTGIYKITSPTNKVYIGQSINIEKRWISYKNLWKITKAQRILYKSLKKYGWEQHKFEILEECKEEQLLERETYWKQYYQVLEKPSLCCRLDGKGGKLSEETKHRISKTRLKLNIKHSKDHIENIRNNMSTSKKLYQYDLNGNLIKIWRSIKEAERCNKGNIKNNFLGKTKKTKNGHIWLREEDLNLLNERLQYSKQPNPLKNVPLSESHRENIRASVKGKEKPHKIIHLYEQLENIKNDYKLLSLPMVAEKYNVSYFTMRKFLEKENLFEFRKNYMKNKIN